MRYGKERAARFQRARTRRVLIMSAAVTVLLYIIPFGRYVAYPLLLLSTFVHEAGHGVAASLMGGNFERFVMFPDGSGMAFSSGIDSPVAMAVMAAGGLLGPALVAAFCFALVRGPWRARVGLAVLTVAALAAVFLVVRNTFGLIFVGGVALGMLYVLFRRSAEDAQVLLSFLAVQLAVSVFSRADYLLMESAQTGAGTIPSDTAQIAEALGGTYWGWGVACGAVSVLVLALGLWWALRSPLLDARANDS